MKHLISMAFCLMASLLVANAAWGVGPSKPVDRDVPADPFLPVFIDSETEKQFGPAPYDRAFLARGVREFDKLGVRAVVVVFFLDLPKTGVGDAELAKVIKDAKAKIILEATADYTVEQPNPLPDRFNIKLPHNPGLKLLGGKSGWVPLPAFSEHACDIGFSDLRKSEDVPLIENYNGKLVKSLFTCALEAGFNGKAELVPGESVVIANHKLTLTPYSEIKIGNPSDEKLVAYSYADLLNGRLDKHQFEDRVVILGYDLPNDPKMNNVNVHRLFCQMLKSSYRKLAETPSARD